MLLDDSTLDNPTFVGNPSYRNFGRLHATTTTLFCASFTRYEPLEKCTPYLVFGCRLSRLASPLFRADDVIQE